MTNPGADETLPPRRRLSAGKRAAFAGLVLLLAAAIGIGVVQRLGRHPRPDAASPAPTASGSPGTGAPGPGAAESVPIADLLVPGTGRLADRTGHGRVSYSVQVTTSMREGLVVTGIELRGPDGRPVPTVEAALLPGPTPSPDAPAQLDVLPPGITYGTLVITIDYDCSAGPPPRWGAQYPTVVIRVAGRQRPEVHPFSYWWRDRRFLAGACG